MSYQGVLRSLLGSHKQRKRVRLHQFWLRWLYFNLAVRRDYSSPAARALRRPSRAPRLLVSGRTRSMSASLCAATTRLRLHALYVNLAVHREHSSPLSRLQRSTSPTPRVWVPRHVVRPVAGFVVDYSVRRNFLLRPHWLYFNPAVRRVYSSSRLHQLYCAYAVHMDAPSRRSTSRRSPRARSSSTTPPHLGSSSTTPPRVWVPQHIARLVTRLVAPLLVDYFASVTHPAASARRAARRRLLRLHRASGCLGTSRGSSRGSSSTTPPRPGSSSTTPPLVWVPRHVARLVTRLVVPLVIDYTARPGASAHRAARRRLLRVTQSRHRLLRAPRLRLAATLALLQPRSGARLLALRQHWLYFEYAARRHDVVLRLHRVDHSS
jgi:hypothetical protein